MIDIKLIRETCPKAVKALEEYHSKNLEGSIEAFKAQGYKDEEIGFFLGDIKRNITAYSENAIKTYPRMLFEFFDSHHIRIFVGESTVDPSLFTYYNSVDRNSSVADSRSLAEESAFIEAFNTLEKQL